MKFIDAVSAGMIGLAIVTGIFWSEIVKPLLLWEFVLGGMQ